MLYQELPRIDSGPVDRLGRWLVPLLVAAAAITFAVVLALFGQFILAGVVVLAGAGGAAVTLRRERPKLPREPLVVGPDFSLVGSALGLSRDPVALTSGEGSLLVVNQAYRDGFGGSRPPLELASDDESRNGLELAKTMAWRDGAGCVAGITTAAGTGPIEVERIGARGDLLLWRFVKPAAADPVSLAANRLRGRAGQAGRVPAGVPQHRTVCAAGFQSVVRRPESDPDLPRPGRAL